MKRGKHPIFTMVIAVAAMMTGTGLAGADSYDLSAGGSVAINSSLFQTGSIQPAGTGVFDSFVRLQMNGTEQGYNTDGRPVAFNELTDPNFTRSLLLTDVSIKTLDGIDYREFVLDINESGSSSGRLLSLDKLKIFLSPTGSSTTSNVSLLGNMVYDLDAGGDNWIKLNASLNGPGSGTSDMFAYIPNSFFIGSNPYVTLYSQFGTNFASDAGFEEWSVQSGGGAAAPVPEPTSMLLLGSGVAAFGAWRRKQLASA